MLRAKFDYDGAQNGCFREMAQGKDHMTAWKRSDALMAPTDQDSDRLFDKEFVLVGSWR